MDIPATFACLGKTYNCTTDNPADPDIVGIGVMAAFLATSVATFATILIAYFGSYLPGIEPNDVDHILLRKRRGELKDDPPKIKKRKEAIEEFILSLSDQQLVTGLAILIAGFLKCDISVYSFENVSAIAWFSCTTHLATLTILKRYFRKHRLVLVLRIIGMLLIAGLLIASNFMTTTAKSTAKAWRQSSGLGSGLDICFYCIFNSGFARTSGSFGIDIIILLWLLWAYPGRIRALYSSEDSNFHIYWKNPSNYTYRLYSIPDKHLWKFYQRFKTICESEVSDYRKDFFCRVYLALFFYQEVTHSYWWEISWLLFAGAFSLSRALWVWLSFSDISGNRVLSEASTAMGFGQMAALLLLAVPCFAALDAFSGQEETKVTPEESKLELAEPEVRKGQPRVKFDSVTMSYMPEPELQRSKREREVEGEMKEERARQRIDSLEIEHAEAEHDNSPDGRKSHHVPQRGEPTIQLGKELEDIIDSDSEEARREKKRAQEASNLATRIATERSLYERLILLASSHSNDSYPIVDPYQIAGYRHLCVIFALLYSIYIIGIGVTMAIAPNVRTLVYASIPIVPEVSVQAVEVILQMNNVWKTYVKDWWTFGRVVISLAKSKYLETRDKIHATRLQEDSLEREMSVNNVV